MPVCCPSALFRLLKQDQINPTEWKRDCYCSSVPTHGPLQDMMSFSSEEVAGRQVEGSLGISGIDSSTPWFFIKEMGARWVVVSILAHKSI